MHEASCASLCYESWAVVIAAALGFVIVLGTVLRHPKVLSEAKKKTSPLGARQHFNFNTSWATNFTVTGAILGPILSANAGTASPAPLLSWHSYQLLSILFGAVIVVAPFVYRNNVRTFLVANVLTLAAVFGQAGAALFITYALGRDAAHQGNPVLVSYLLFVVILVGIGSIVRYVWQGIPDTIKHYEAHRRAHPHAPAEAKAPREQQPESNERIRAVLQRHGEANAELYAELEQAWGMDSKRKAAPPVKLWI